MESLTILQILAFSTAAYLVGYSTGRKVGYIKAIKSIPITVLKISNELELEEIPNEQNNTPT